MVKKFIFLICSVVLFSTIAPSFGGSAKAATISNEVTSSGEYEIEYLVDTKDYQKIKFTNTKTGEVEFLETFLSQGTSKYVSTFTDEETKQETQVEVIKEGDEVTTHNLTTNEVVTEKLEVLKDSIQPMALPGGNGDYVLQATFKGSKTISDSAVGVVSLIAGLVASVYGGPVAGVVVTIATYLATAGATKFYYIDELYYWRDIPVYPASYVRYYENSNYTGFINTVWQTSR